MCMAKVRSLNLLPWISKPVQILNPKTAGRWTWVDRLARVRGVFCTVGTEEGFSGSYGRGCLANAVAVAATSRPMQSGRKYVKRADGPLQ